MDSKGVSSSLSSSGSWKEEWLDYKILFSLCYPGGVLIFLWALSIAAFISICGPNPLYKI